MIVANLVVHDAEEFLPELIASIRDAVDVIVVGVDNRTTDDTRDVARDLGCDVLDVEFMRDGVMDFGQARSQVLAYTKEHYPDEEWMFWIDRDDVLGDGKGGPPQVSLKQLIAEATAERPNVESIWMPYLYSRYADGRPWMRHYRERLLRMSAHPHWMARLHETCHTDHVATSIWAESDLDYSKARIWVDHWKQKETEANKWERNFPILMKMVEEDPKDYRAVREVAEAYYASTRFDMAVEWFDRYLALTQTDIGTPLAERWLVVVYKAKALRMLHRIRESLQSADRALLMMPQYADSYFELAYGYLEEGHWTKAIHWFEEGIKHPAPDGILQTVPDDYEVMPYQHIHRAYFETGQIEKAIEYAQRALQYLPDDPALNHASIAYTHYYNRKVVVDGALTHAQYLLDLNEPEKAKAVLATLPAGSREEHSKIVDMEKDIELRLSYLDNPISFRKFHASAPDMPVLNIVADARLRSIDEVLVRKGVKRVLWVGLGNPYNVVELANHMQVVGGDIVPARMAKANYLAVDKGYIQLRPAPEYSPMLEDYSEEHPHENWTADCDRCGPVNMLPDLDPLDLQIQSHVFDMERPSLVVKSLGPYDAIVLYGVLERVRDVDLALKNAEELAPLVIVSTVDGTAPMDNRWGVLRSWSRIELETKLWSRGRLIESHLDADSPSHMLMAYKPGESMDAWLPVKIFCGPGLEAWTPDHLDRTGLGGSETAVIQLARELVKMHFRVMVYAEAEGMWDGVFYRHHSKWVPSDPSWAFIGWRSPSLFDAPIAAELNVLWLHDIDAGDALTDERAAKLDVVFGVSEWHAEHLKTKHPNVAEKIAVLPNGIDPNRFVGSEARDPHRFIYVSSPDRGLERALVMWPFIKKEIPEATFHVYYGWENYDRLGRDPSFKNWIMDKAKADGVVWHGRVGQRELAREMMKSGALFYPGPHGFEETFCISALEAQAAGCIPVTRDNGALKEVNVWGVLLPTAEATISNYIDELKYSIDFPNDARTKIADWARAWNWSRSADAFVDTAERILTKRAEAEEEKKREADRGVSEPGATESSEDGVGVVL